MIASLAAEASGAGADQVRVEAQVGEALSTIA
jgi:hypothetical protein